jgi:hypothetical protein
LEKDLKRFSGHANRAGKEFSMTVAGGIFGKDERKEAGEAILEACNGIHGIKSAAKIGEYMGFDMTAVYNFATQKVQIGLRADGVTHAVELGESATGNITRIDNALEKIPERLEFAKTYMEDLHKQLESAKEELERPFPQAKELEEKSARLAELDILLSMDSHEQKEERENALQEDVKDTEENDPLREQESAAALDSKPVNDAGITGIEEEKQGKNEAVGDISKNNEKILPFNPEVGRKVIFSPLGGQAKLTGEVVDVSDTRVTLLAGRMEIPVIRDKGTFAEAPDKTKTLERVVSAAFRGEEEKEINEKEGCYR